MGEERSEGYYPEIRIVEMDSASSCSKSAVGDSGSNKKCKEERDRSDYYQQNDQSLTRFVLSNGKLNEKQLHLLRHPKTGNATLYAIGNERVEELLKFDDGFRSVLLGNNVISDGSLILLAPMNPTLLLLPYLRKYAKDDYVSLKDILVDDYFPAIKLLENVKAVKSSLRHSCQFKEISNIETYKYSESLLVNYIMNKLELMKKSNHCNSDYAVRGILEENLPPDILRLIGTDFVRVGNENATNKSQYKDSESREGRDEILGGAIRPLQETDPIAVEVPTKKLRSGKIFSR
ncbi:Ribonuclease H2 subunit [Dirofilaria immitis]